MDLTSHITHWNVYAPYIAYYRSNGIHQLFRKLKPKPKLNPPNAHRSQIKFAFQTCQTCQTRFEFLSQFRKVRNAFECFLTQVQTRLPKTKCVWPMKINVICTVSIACECYNELITRWLEQLRQWPFQLMNRVHVLCIRFTKSFNNGHSPSSVKTTDLGCFVNTF